MKNSLILKGDKSGRELLEMFFSGEGGGGCPQQL